MKSVIKAVGIYIATPLLISAAATAGIVVGASVGTKITNRLAGDKSHLAVA